ncbi:MAG TPA: TetR/AcrR family transcriptional regulator [Kofleriaceae bacterium]|jgi:AcrR family transcriptional regulator
MRRPPKLLTRETIVLAAMRIADADGLSAVSLRNVAATLDAGPMRIYTHVATKEALLELMVDQVYAEMPARLPAPWRRALRVMADHLRAGALAHPWFVELLGSRPFQGPHALAHLEAALAAVAAEPAFENIDDVLDAVRTTTAYVVGALWSELVERRAERSTGLSKSAWQDQNWPQLERVLASGTFPMLRRVAEDARHPSLEAAFHRGLDTVLGGLEARWSASVRW